MLYFYIYCETFKINLTETCFVRILVSTLNIYVVDIFMGRRSVVFVSMDTAYLNTGSHEFVEEQLREYGERLIAVVYLGGVLSPGK